MRVFNPPPPPTWSAHTLTTGISQNCILCVQENTVSYFLSEIFVKENFGMLSLEFGEKYIGWRCQNYLCFSGLVQHIEKKLIVLCKMYFFINFRLWANFSKNLAKKVRTVVKAAFYVSRWTIREKIGFSLENFVFSNLFRMFREIGWTFDKKLNFPQVFQNCILHVQKKLLGKFFLRNLKIKLFGLWAKKFRPSCQNFWAGLQRLFCVFRRKFLGRTIFFENFIYYQSFPDFEQTFLKFSREIISRVTETVFYVSRKTLWGKNVYWKKYFFYFYI